MLMIVWGGKAVGFPHVRKSPWPREIWNKHTLGGIKAGKSRDGGQLVSKSQECRVSTQNAARTLVGDRERTGLRP